MRSRSSISGSIMLLLTAMIWGCAFVAQSEAMNYMQPFTFQSVRSIIGALVLIPVILASDTAKKKLKLYREPAKNDKKRLLFAGAVCGCLLCTASMFQQFGINLGTGSGKAGFITAVYILLVPVIGIFLKKKVRPVIWICITAAMAGLYLLCMTDSLAFHSSDLLVLGCALLFALHIVAVDRLSPGLDGVRLSCIQFAVSGILSGICMFIFETPSLEQLKSGWLTLAYAGVMSCGVAYTLQILGQQRTEPAVASLLMSFESVFAVLGGIVIQKQIPTMREAAGCVLMFAAIVTAQVAGSTRKRKSD